MNRLIGKTLGRYRILAEIGRGGMGTVYKALEPSRHRYVALKMLPAFLSQDETFVKRFRREAQAAKKLNHPNIIKIYETGQVEGCSFIAMEYIEGGSLQDRLRRGQPLDRATVVNIVSQIASALDYAHSRGVIHRDIKPSNILLTRDGRAILSDFGLAKTFDSSWLTAPSTVMGTPYYMAPEQVRGVREVDHRADIYSLGAVCYQMLTGRVPFERTTPHAVMHAHIYEAPVPPRRINPRIPPALEEVVLHALEKDPAARYQSASELAADLRSGFLAPHARARAEAIRRPRTRPQEARGLSREELREAPPGERAMPSWAMVALVVGGFLLMALIGYQMVTGISGRSTTTPGPSRTTVAATATALSQMTAKPGSYPLVGKRYIQRGEYQGVIYQGVLSIDKVEVSARDMTFYLSEVFTYSGEGFRFGKRSDVGNKLVYLTDNLGYRYDQIAVGGDFARDMMMEDGLRASGWFKFPPPRPGAYVFTFRMDDQQVVIEDIVLR